MSDSKTAKILVAYPSAFFLPGSIIREEIKSAPLLLASYLSQFFEVRYADFELSIGRPETDIQVRRFERKVREFLENAEFDILAISCWTSFSYQASIAVARIAREIFPDRLIVIGGYHATARPNDFASRADLFDFVVRCEGELALKEIAETFHKAKRPSSCQVILGGPLDPEHFVPMNWDLLQDSMNAEIPESIGTISLFLSRGCPFKCSFCMESQKDQSWRAMAPDAAIEEVKRAAERFNVTAIAVADACFGMGREWRKEFLAKLAELKPGCWILFETRPEYIDKENIRLLSELRVEIQFGIESGSPRMLQLMNKSRRPEKFLAKFSEISHALSEHKIVHGANMIFNHPGETPESLRETFALIDRELESGNSSLIWACHGYMHFPGSEVDRNQSSYEDKYGSVFQIPEWWKQPGNPYVSARNVIPSAELSGARVGLWQEMLKLREERMKANLTREAFFIAAQSYYPSWANDPRS